MELTDCVEEYKKQNITLPMKETVMNGFMCIKDFDIYLSGSYLEDHLSYLQINVKTCQNSTFYPENNTDTDELIKSNINLIKDIKDLHNTNYHTIKYKNGEEDLNLFDKVEKYLNKPIESKGYCKSQNDIEKLVTELSINFYYNNVKTNIKSYEEPLVPSPVIDYYFLGNSFRKIVTYYFYNHVIENDTGIIFHDKFYQTNQIGLFKKETDFKIKEKTSTDDDTILHFSEIFISNNVRIISRKYIKVQGIFANLGGFISLIILIFQTLSFPILRKKLNLEIINELFDFDDKINYNEKERHIEIDKSLNKENKVSKKSKNKEIENNNENKNKNNLNKENNIIKKNVHSKIFENNKLSIMNENENSIIFKKDIDNSNKINLKFDSFNFKNKSINLEVNVIKGKQKENIKINDNKNLPLSIELQQKIKENENINDNSSRQLDLNNELKKNDLNSNSKLIEKINDIINSTVNKLHFTSIEILKSSYGLMCYDKKIKIKIIFIISLFKL